MAKPSSGQIEILTSLKEYVLTEMRAMKFWRQETLLPLHPIPLAVNTAYVCAKLKLAQSKKCYPQPPEKGMVGFNKPKLKVVS